MQSDALLMENFDGTRVRPRAYISWQFEHRGDTVGRDGQTVGREPPRQSVVCETPWPGGTEAVSSVGCVRRTVA